MGLRGDKNWTQRQGLQTPAGYAPNWIVNWGVVDPKLPHIFNPKLRGQASLTSHGWPATWSTLQLTPALPDLTTALARRTQPVIQPFSAGTAQGRIQVPPVYVPVKSTGWGGGYGQQ
jgi:hypothetical protein